MIPEGRTEEDIRRHGGLGGGASDPVGTARVKVEQHGGARTGVKRLTKPMRRLLYVAAALVLLAGLDLSVLTDHTDRYFAWTVTPGLTAAFLGAGDLEQADKDRATAEARIAAPAVLVFTALTLAVTILHRSRFHFDSLHPVARLWAWAWLAIYVLVPVIMIVVLAGQARAPGGDPPRRRPVPVWATTILAAQGTVLLVLGSALLMSPGRAASWWPWMLTPLTGRAIGAWQVGVGIAAAHAILERELDRLRPAAAAAAVLGALQLVALARYRSDVNWHGPAGWVYWGSSPASSYLVLPDGRWYVSIAHTDDDIERTLEVVRAVCHSG